MILSMMKQYKIWLNHFQVDFSNELKLKEIWFHINFRIYYIFSHYLSQFFYWYCAEYCKKFIQRDKKSQHIDKIIKLMEYFNLK